MLYVPEMLAFISRPGVTWVVAWVCNWGAPWAIPTAVIANHGAIHAINRGCPGCRYQFLLIGKAEDGRIWTVIAGPYWRHFATAWAKGWDVLRGLAGSSRAAHIDGWASMQTSDSSAQALSDANRVQQ